MVVHLLPMEPFEERYTAQWLWWWADDLRLAGLGVNVVRGRIGVGERESGEFADIFKTWQWKGSQTEALATAFQEDEIEDGDVILCLEGWGSPTTAAAYLRDITGRKIYLVIFMHAGTYDPWDYLRPLHHWAHHIEKGWLRSADLILVGSKFHRDLLLTSCDVPREKIHVVGVPIKPSYFQTQLVPWSVRELLVVFPHRLTASKAPWEFENIQRIFEDKYGERIDDREVVWIKTRDPSFAESKFDGYSSKSHFYRLLANSRVVVSTARQETFGIAMQEGAALGAWPVAPNRLCYPEVIRDGFLYNDLEQAADRVYDALVSDSSPEWDGYHEKAILRAASEIIGRFSGEPR